MTRESGRQGGTPLPRLLVLAALSVAAFLIGAWLHRSVASRPSASTRATASGDPLASYDEGTELVFVYIGSSTCGSATDEDLPPIIRTARDSARSFARRHGWRFVSHGIALDQRVAAGISHLEEVGRFDEVSAGRGWLNVGAFEYLWEEIPGQASIPQVVVARRELRVTDTGFGLENSYDLVGRKLLKRVVGGYELERWRGNGYALPLVTDS